MKISKTNQEEISILNSLLNDIECISQDFREGNDFNDIEWEYYENLHSQFPTENIEDFFTCLVHFIAGSKFQRILMNCSVMLSNCADENQDTLDFNPKIKAGFEAIELLKEINEYLSPNAKNSICTSSIIHEKIKSLLSKVPQE